MRSRRFLIVALIVLAILVVAAGIAVRVLLGGDAIKSAIEAQASAALGHPVTIGSATPRLFPRVSLDLTEVVVGKGREVVLNRIRLSTGLRALVGRRVQDGQVSVEGSQIDVRWALAMMAALIKPAAPSPSPAGSQYALTIESITAIALRDVTLVAGQHSLRVEMDSAMSGPDRLMVRRLQAESGSSSGVNAGAVHSRFAVSGEIASIARLIGAFKLDAEALHLDALLAFFAAATPAGGEAAGDPNPAPAGDADYKIDVEIRAGRALAFDVALSRLAATAHLTGNRVALEGLQGEVFGGRFAGNGAFVGAAEPRYQWRGQFENLDVPALVEFAGASGSITGRLGGSLSLAASGVDPMAAIRRSRGSARVIVRDGKIPGLEIVRSVILAFGRPTGERPAGSGEAFTQLAATLDVGGGALTTNDLTFSSRDFDMTGKGRLSLTTQAVDFTTDVMLSRELSAQAGRDLYRLAREGDRVVLPARITGTVTSPTVFVDVQAALGRALRNRAADEIKSIFDRFRKQIVK